MTGIEKQTSAAFEIDLKPADPLIVGTDRFTFTKTWHGAMSGKGEGVMLSAGDPASGAAGYVAIERFDGTVDGQYGEFALQQFGSMSGGQQDLRYEVVPGSGIGELTGIRGTVELHIDDEGNHTVSLRYSLPG